MAKTRLSKSTFIRGLQCEKSLYLYKHHYQLKDPTPTSLQAIFDQGTHIGKLAQGLFPNGEDASPENHFRIMESVRKTMEFIARGDSVIYEATFFYNDIVAALDILVKDASGWKAYEVKSSTKVSDTYVKDAAIQYYTITNSGIALQDISIVYINNQYVRNGELEIDKLFSIESVFDRVQDFLPLIPAEIKRLQGVIGQNEAPIIDIGPHCSDPYDCDFKGTCWAHIPDYSVFDISRLKSTKKFELYRQGIISFDQIDATSVALNENQRLQVESERTGFTHIEAAPIKEFTHALNFPLYFLDFETIGPAVPIYDGSRPYQQMVFQYSLHVKNTPRAEIDHFEYLANPEEDPRVGFVEQLIEDCGLEGDILVYNIGFERGKLNDLIDVFPQYSVEISNIIERLKDLMIPFQQKWYYTPEMKGSYSIKYVLPALVPELSYNSLDIKEGGTASNTFLSMVNGTFTGDTNKVRGQLKEYCKMDTFAMVKILEKLQVI